MMPTTLADIRQFFGSGDNVIPTLGARGELTIRVTPTQILILNGQGNGLTLTQNILDQVVIRRANLAASGEENMASRYVYPRWPNPPAGQHTPSVPAVLRAMGR